MSISLIQLDSKVESYVVVIMSDDYILLILIIIQNININ